jgi:hypothetical protein
MADSSAAQTLFESWTKQMEEGVQTWARMVGQMGTVGPAQAPDPMRMWKPFMDQATDAWAKALRQGVPVGDLSAQWKTFLDQWIAAWDKTLAQTVESEPFAKALGQYLDQWLAVQGPMRKAVSESTEATLQALGVPSRTQIVGVSRQLMDLDDRIEDIEQRLAALTARIEEVLSARERPLSQPSRAKKKGSS